MFGSTSSRASDLAADLDRLRSDIATLATSVSDLVREGSSDARGQLAHARRGVDETLSRLGSVSSSAASQARDRFVDANAQLETRIGERPIASVLIAAGIGFVLGVMSRGRP